MSDPFGGREAEARSIGSVLSEMREFTALRAAVRRKPGIRAAVHPQA